MTDLEDEIFQALCQLDYLRDHIDEGGRIEHVINDIVTMVLSDGSETTICLAPIQSLLNALRKMN